MANVWIRDTRYNTEEARFLTFLSPDWPPETPVTIQGLARAGFYCLRSGDRVKCHSCGGILHAWVAGDIPIDEHRKHFPQCRFVQQHDANVATPPESSIQLAKHVDDDTITLKNWRASCAVQTVREMDIFPLEVIECAVKQLLIDECKNTFDSSSLLDTIFQIEDKKNVDNICTSVNALTIKPREHKSVETLEREIETLKSARLCKICIDATVAILFLPCRHLVCCEACSKQLRRCPICRGQIVADIKAYCN